MRTILSSDIDEFLVDRTLRSGVRWLRFPAALESHFEAYAADSRARRLVARGLIGLTVYDIFLLADWQVTPDVFLIALLLRLAVVTPLSLILLVVLWFKPPVWLRESIATASIPLAAATTLGLMLLSHAPYREGQHHAIILAILFATIVQRVRFPYAVTGCLLGLLLHAVALLAVAEYPHQLWVSNNLTLGSAIVLALIAAYTLERDSRLAYLTALSERLRSERLAELSTHDALTGLANRRALDQTLLRLEASPADEDLAVLLFDVDRFKLYNDTLGHPSGDLCLKRIAEVIRRELPDSAALAFRFGGEEFLALLPGMSLPAAVAVAERIRRAVEAEAMPHPGIIAGSIVTVSGGAASAKLGRGISSSEIIAGADAALYAAKRNGRNQVWPPFLSPRREEVVSLPPRDARAK